jgi:hypothetical protein
MPDRGDGFEPLNARFRGGRPSTIPSEAGVLIHSWDKMEDPEQPWLPCLQERCERHERGKTNFLPASIIYYAMPHPNSTIPMFGGGLRGGVVLRPMPSELRCAYPADGNSRWRSDGCSCPFIGHVQSGRARASHCVHWCQPPVRASPPFREETLLKTLRCSGKAWPPSHLEQMLSRTRHAFELLLATNQTDRQRWLVRSINEVVVSPTAWNASLDDQLARWNASMPRMVEAFYYPISRHGECCNHDGKCSAGCGDFERAAHARFLAQHGVTAAQVPLLQLRRDNWHEPFACDTCSGVPTGLPKSRPPPPMRHPPPPPPHVRLIGLRTKNTAVLNGGTGVLLSPDIARDASGRLTGRVPVRILEPLSEAGRVWLLKPTNLRFPGGPDHPGPLRRGPD